VVPSEPDLQTYIERSPDSIQVLKGEVFDAALALKYAMRTFEMVDKKVNAS